jgi:flagellar L-ring protein FlgH
MLLHWRIKTVLLSVLISSACASQLFADNLYAQGLSQSLAADIRASSIGDNVTVVIVQTSESSTTVRTGTRRSTSLGGQVGVGSINESADFSLGSNVDGQGQSTRSERFITQMTSRITQVLPNGNLLITGIQRLNINGEATTVEVRGIVRTVDIDAENRVPSNRIADAQINYQGKGFASRGAQPGLLQRLFNLFGLL